MSEYKPKILISFGTRPEAIKLAPVAKELQRRDVFETIICVTAQHRQMLDQVLELFQIDPDYDLNLMSPDQTLENLTGVIVTEVSKVLSNEKPDCVIVQGDTTTTFATALAAFYQRIPVAHVEAGLRTYNMYSPFPEEINRRMTSALTKWHFAPTDRSGKALLQENYDSTDVYMVGNTVIDSLLMVAEKINREKFDILKHLSISASDDSVILVTGHRRENFGEGFLNICRALAEISDIYPHSTIIYPVHLNPHVQQPVFDTLSNKENIFLIDPQNYYNFVSLLNKCKIVLTDSGGVQEEAPSLGKPVLVMRDTTERPEAVEGGVAKLVGTDRKRIVEEVVRLMDDTEAYNQMAHAQNPFGDGNSSGRIADILQKQLIQQ